MAKDAKLPEIEIKRTNFTNENQRNVARRLVGEWEENGPQAFKDLAEKYGDFSDGMYGKVYSEYIGPPDHNITVEEIRARYGNVKSYLDERKADNVELDTTEIGDGELEMWKKGYREGFKHGLEDASDIRFDAD